MEGKINKEIGNSAIFLLGFMAPERLPMVEKLPKALTFHLSI